MFYFFKSRFIHGNSGTFDDVGDISLGDNTRLKLWF